MESGDNIYSIYLSIRDSLARAVMGIVPPKEVEDIVQETYVRVCQIKKMEAINSPRSFLFKTARNLALDHVKRAETRLAISVEDTVDGEFGAAGRLADATFDEVASNEEFARFCEAVRRLPVQCRRAFVLKKVYGHSQREVAREMGITENTVEKHIALGIKRCTYFMAQFEMTNHLGGEDTTKKQATATISSRKGRRS